VFDTAIVAGVMAAKKTHEIVPFCHPLAIERCTIDIADGPRGTLRIVCSVAVHHKTGVEMEALTGATAAALTIYDMCKALSHDIEIGPVRLLAKRGGKRDFARGRRRAGAHERRRRCLAWCWPAAAARACSATRRPSPTTARRPSSSRR
jgi:cyclic pyranopterin phosphate synthase